MTTPEIQAQAQAQAEAQAPTAQAQAPVSSTENNTEYPLLPPVSGSKCTDYFVLLGVSKAASNEEIKNAFMRKALIWHPDKAKTPADRQRYEQLYIDLQKACKILLNPVSRQQYLASQAATVLDLRAVERDVGYSDPDPEYLKTNDKGEVVFDKDHFHQQFEGTRDATDAAALAQLAELVPQAATPAPAAADMQTMLERRQRDRELDLALITQQQQSAADFFQQQSAEGKFNRDSFNRMFDYMQKRAPSTAVTPYSGQPGALFSATTGVEELAKLDFGQATNFAQRSDIDQLIAGTASNPTISDIEAALADSALTGSGPYGLVTPASQEELNVRIHGIDREREQLALLQPEEFDVTATEIEQLYSDLFVQAPCEGLEPPKPIGVITSTSSKTKPDPAATVTVKPIKLKAQVTVKGSKN
jgi:curved DNA-binding protein CbpA